MPQQRTAMEEFITSRWDRDTAHDILDQATERVARGQMVNGNDIEWGGLPNDAPATIGHHHPEIDDALGRAAHKDDIRDIRREISGLRTDMWSRVAAGPETTPAYDWRADLIGRLTSRKFALTVAGVVIVVIATLNGSLTADQALDKLPWILGLFIAGESAVDAATALKGHAPAPPPRETPHAD